jgi:hypothetical protein
MLVESYALDAAWTFIELVTNVILSNAQSEATAMRAWLGAQALRRGETFARVSYHFSGREISLLITRFTTLSVFR